MNRHLKKNKKQEWRNPASQRTNSVRVAPKHTLDWQPTSLAFFTFLHGPAGFSRELPAIAIFLLPQSFLFPAPLLSANLCFYFQVTSLMLLGISLRYGTDLTTPGARVEERGRGEDGTVSRPAVRSYRKATSGREGRLFPNSSKYTTYKSTSRPFMPDNLCIRRPNNTFRAQIFSRKAIESPFAEMNRAPHHSYLRRWQPSRPPLALQLPNYRRFIRKLFINSFRLCSKGSTTPTNTLKKTNL